MGVGHPDKRMDKMAQDAIDAMNRPGPNRSAGGSSNNRSKSSNSTKYKDDSKFWFWVIVIFLAAMFIAKHM